MLRSCKYCGRVHEATYTCPHKAARIKAKNYRQNTAADKFRHTLAWTKMSKRVRDRDHYMCLCCADGIPKDYGLSKEIETEGLSVHHIQPIEESYELRLDETNLITVCARHHEMCESQMISRDKQRELVQKSIERRDKNALVCL